MRVPLTEENYQKFYRGNSAECFVMGKAYFHGFEAHKYNPDFGLDLAISNKARTQFKEEKSKQLDLQVKSSLVVKERAIFYISKEEVEFLLTQDQAATVFCMFEVQFLQNPEVFHNRYSSISDNYVIDNWLESSIREHCFHNQFDTKYYEDKFEYMRNRRDAESLDVDDVQVTLFWLNKKQLGKAIELGLMTEVPKRSENAEGLYKLSIQKDSEGWSFEMYKNSDITHYMPYPEICSLSYLLLGCTGGSSLNLDEFCSID